MEKLVLVHGWFSEKGMRVNLNEQNGMGIGLYTAEGPMMFSGCFRFNGEEFEGRISDFCGLADVSLGNLQHGRLSFIKTYIHRGDPINYEFVQKDGSAIYVGSYEGTLVGSGDARIMLIDAPSELFS